jgi:RNA polymerase sigma-70 factor (ECF subfamily)
LTPEQATEVPSLTEHLFRQESAKMVSVLTAHFGIDRLQMVEDVVQEALVRALKTWPFHGIPENPPAWLMQTAKNLALDVVRREKVFHEKEPAIVASIEQRLNSNNDGEDNAPMFDEEIKDNRLRLMFACCHPLLPEEAQTALALKTLCGFSPAEIANAFLTSEAAIAKRLTRARQRIQANHIPFEIPTGAELSTRLDGVLQILYLLFNEGYKASSGDSLVRVELCQEAIQLAKLLTDHPAANQPRTHALTSLMLLNAARLPARVDTMGNVLRLKDQDRTKWNRTMIALGLFHLSQAASGDELSEYHLQAGIAACHDMAPDYESTDWQRILFHYDQWVALNDSPLVALNRAVALANVKGPQAGLEAVAAIPNREQLGDYYLVDAVLGDFEEQVGDFKAAAEHFRRAMQNTEVTSERAFLEKRLLACLNQR